MTDRDRLASAFDELRGLGYYAPTDGAWRFCCASCAMNAVDVEADDPHLFVFWTSQKDDYAFVENGGMPLSDEIVRRQWAESGANDVPPLEQDRREQLLDDWADAHLDELIADEIHQRTSQLTTLVDPLYLHWCGESEVIVGVLRAHGLNVPGVPNGDGYCIEVHPARAATTRVAGAQPTS